MLGSMLFRSKTNTHTHTCNHHLFITANGCPVCACVYVGACVRVLSYTILKCRYIALLHYISVSFYHCTGLL